MIYNKEKREIILKRKISNLDKFVIDFTNLLDKYVLVSGYVSILFGRARATEDIDLLIPKCDFKNFEKLWEKIHKNGFECINTSNVKDAFDMLNQFAIRFARKNKAIPNMEFKIIKNDLDNYSFNNKLKVIIGKNTLFISDLEMQIAYKKYLLKSDKDIEDAMHLEGLFKEKLDYAKINKLKEIIQKRQDG
jgi:tRNA U34 5-carboxymethylaminomethyl modifying enzyme MnmG/GidA